MGNIHRLNYPNPLGEARISDISPLVKPCTKEKNAHRYEQTYHPRSSSPLPPLSSSWISRM